LLVVAFENALSEGGEVTDGQSDFGLLEKYSVPIINATTIFQKLSKMDWDNL